MAAQYDAAAEDIDADFVDADATVEQFLVGTDQPQSNLIGAEVHADAQVVAEGDEVDIDAQFEEFLVGTDAPTGLNITTSSPLAGATQGLTYSTTLAATGGSGTYPLWQLVGGSLNPFNGNVVGPLPAPALTVNFNGVVQGLSLPNAETDTFTVMVQDSSGAQATKSLSLTASTGTLLFSLPDTDQFYTHIDPNVTSTYICQDSWAGSFGGNMIGYSSRYWTATVPQAYASGQTYGFPFVNRGWYPAQANPCATVNGGTSSAPGVNNCIQISALTKAKLRVIEQVPVDRTKAEYDLLCDHYFYNAPNPGGAGSSFGTSGGTYPTIFSLNLFAGILDTAEYWSEMVGTGSGSPAARRALQTLSSSNYNNTSTSGRIALDDKMWWYTLTNQSWAQTPGSGLYNCLRLFPAPWNDTQQMGTGYLSVNYLQLITDLLASSLASQIPLTSSMYLGNLNAGFETNGLGTIASITGATNASSLVVTNSSSASANPFPVGTIVGFKSVGGMTQLNTINGIVTAAGGSSGAWTNTININSSSFGTWTSGGSIHNCAVSVLDFQTALQSEADPVIYTVPQISQNIGRRQPIATNVSTIDPAINANTANYNIWFRSNAAPSSGSPVELAIDLTATSSTQRSSLMMNWSGEDGNDGYYGEGYDLPGTYTIQGNPASFTGGTTPPTSGWVTLLTVTGNTRTARTHYLGNCSAYNSFKMSVTAGSPNNTLNDVGLHWDWSYAPETTGAPDGWLILGDSITNKCLQPWDTEEGGASDYAGQIISHYTGHIPVVECGGNSGWTLYGISSDTTAVINFVNGTFGTWINDFPGRYIMLRLGTNDAATGVSQANFQSALVYVINLCLSLGKTIVIPSIPYRTDGSNGPNVTFSGYITSTLATYAWNSGTSYTVGQYAANNGIMYICTAANTNEAPPNSSYWSPVGGNPQAMAGPDMQTITSNFSSFWYNSYDAIHPCPYGQATDRAVVCDWIARVIYLGMPASQWEPPYSVGTGVGGH